ncbi:hypothetical protein [Streptomyces mexicanus]
MPEFNRIARERNNRGIAGSFNERPESFAERLSGRTRADRVTAPGALL